MPLGPGTRVGPYEVITAIGAGGMGEVYRARDSRLGRDVAIKILPESFAADPDRLARFEREAQLLASLNHQNVAILYVSDESQRQEVYAAPFALSRGLSGKRQISTAGMICSTEARHDGGRMAGRSFT